MDFLTEFAKEYPMFVQPASNFLGIIVGFFTVFSIQWYVQRHFYRRQLIDHEYQAREKKLDIKKERLEEVYKSVETYNREITNLITHIRTNISCANDANISDSVREAIDNSLKSGAISLNSDKTKIHEAYLSTNLYFESISKFSIDFINMDQRFYIILEDIIKRNDYEWKPEMLDELEKIRDCIILWKKSVVKLGKKLDFFNV